MLSPYLKKTVAHIPVPKPHIPHPTSHIPLLLLLLVFLFTTTSLFAQSDRNLLRSGNEHYSNNKFGEAEIAYRKAINKDEKDELEMAAFNLGDALYQQERYAEAADNFAQAAGELKARTDKAKAFHNMGNAYLKALMSGQEKEGEQFLEKSIEAFKNAIRHNPQDEASKHNLAYAKNIQKQQQQQEQQDQQNQDQENQDENKDSEEKKDQEQQDQENKDEQQQQDEQKKSEEQKKEEQEQQQQKGDKGEKEEEQQQQKGEKDEKQDEQSSDQKELQEQQESRQLTKEEAARLLQALKNEELKVQQKLQKQKGKGQKIKIEKDW